ncbi:MAG: chromate transporter [Erysipelotrichaceae bacterium]|nr:chromate transporter [Erysipelotrichaceae bacterium]
MISVIAIFLSFLKIGLFAFGGAYAVLPLIEEEMVINTGWMTFAEFSDLVAIDELTPGPIIINSATFIGMKLGGLPGALAATLGCILPGCVISLLLVVLYRKYREIPVIAEAMRTLRCMAVALIFSVLLKMLVSAIFPSGLNNVSDISLLTLALVVASFYVMRKYKTNPLYVMLACGGITLMLSLISGTA